ncbi:MAG: hypothetical protein AAB116_04210, partial [Candidatus Poribacteria bacterium]
MKGKKAKLADVEKAIIEKSEYNFLYVTEVIKDIEHGNIDPSHPDDFPPGLIGIYQKFFDRLFPNEEDYDKIRPLLEIIVASKEPLTLEQIAFFMCCEEFDLRRELSKIITFFPERDGRYYPYHKRIADWLSGDVGEDTTWTINVKKGHNVIAEKLLSDKIPESLKRYKLTHLPAHLASGARLDELKSILTNYKFMEEKLNQVGVVELIKDYDFLPGDRDLRMIQGALRLSANALRRDPNELISQLYGRLMSDDSAAIKDMLDNAKKIHKPWLRMLEQSLTPPGGSLIRTLEGHSSSVESVAITSDGRKVVSASWDSTLKVWDIETGDEIRTLKGHSSRVLSVAITPDGRKVVSASSDNTLKVWDIETGDEIRTLKG